MAEKELKVIEEKQESVSECCEPECGPTTCEPATEAVEAKVAEESKKASSGCGPSTCS